MFLLRLHIIPHLFLGKKVFFYFWEIPQSIYLFYLGNFTETP